MPSRAEHPLGLAFLALFVLVFGTPAALPALRRSAGRLPLLRLHPSTSTITPRDPTRQAAARAHMRHHFQDHRYGFGVSSPLWDVVFRTLPRRRAG